MTSVLLASNAVMEAIGPLPDEIDLHFLEPGAEPGADHLGVHVVVLAAELQPVLPRLGEFRELTLVQTLNAGVEWLLPLVPDGVTVCNASGPHDVAVAEWVVAVVLAHYHRLPHYLEMQRLGRWDTQGNALTTPSLEIPGDDVEGKTVTILGHGSIGRAVAARLEPFGARVRGISRRGWGGCATPDALPELAASSDVLVVMCPLTEQTRAIVDAATLARLPDGAIVVNGSRGAVVDQAALEAELRSGRLRAAIDVTDPEPLPAGHSLWSAPNLILTPHTAGSTRRWLERAYRLVGDQLRRHAAGEPLENVRGDY